MIKFDNSHLLLALIGIVAVVAIFGLAVMPRLDLSSSTISNLPQRNLGGQATALGNDARCVRVVAPAQVTAGRTFSAQIIMENGGSTTWPAMEWYNLGSQNPSDNSMWGTGRVSLYSATLPGRNASFSREFTAPSTPGNYSFSWRMVQDGREWFGETCTRYIVVTAPKANDALCLNITPNLYGAPWEAMAPGRVYVASVTMKNTGSQAWPAYQWHNLGSYSPTDNTVWGRGRVRVPYNVTPGQTVTFLFNVTAPATEGPYSFDWRMVQDGVEWFGAPCTSTAYVNATTR